MIDRTVVISCGEQSIFHDELKFAITRFQDAGLKVEVQFSTTQAGAYGVKFQALVIGRIG